MLGIKNLRDELIPDPPSTEDVNRYNDTGRNGPSRLPGEWRPDLVGRKKSPWNKAAVRRFRSHFNKCQQYGEWPAEEVERALFVHMDTLRARYKDKIGQRSLDERLQVKKKAARLSRLKTVSSQQPPTSTNRHSLSSYS